MATNALTKLFEVATKGMAPITANIMLQQIRTNIDTRKTSQEIVSSIAEYMRSAQNLLNEIANHPKCNKAYKQRIQTQLTRLSGNDTTTSDKS